MIGTDCIGSCQSNYHTITTTTAPIFIGGKTFPTVKFRIPAFFLSRILVFFSRMTLCQIVVRKVEDNKGVIRQDNAMAQRGNQTRQCNVKKDKQLFTNTRRKSKY